MDLRAPVTATICVLTFNGESFLDEVLRSCLAQDATFHYEVLVVDSGSTDATLDIVARHDAVRLHRIPNREFGHGRTRNLAVSLAAGDIVVFLTQDATPVGASWLRTLVSPLLDDRSLAGVFARQRPRPECRPTTARHVAGVFGATPPPDFFSNVCSAVRVDVLRRIPFRDVSYAEDRAFAADATAAGMRVSYVAEAEVLHSNDLPLGAYLRRMYDEARGIRGIGGTTRTGILWLLAATVRGTVQDWVFLGGRDEYSLPAKLRHAAEVPLYNVARRLAIWLAARPLSTGVAARLSLDAQRRRITLG